MKKQTALMNHWQLCQYLRKLHLPQVVPPPDLATLKLLQDEDREYGYLVERGNKFVGVVSIDSLKTALSENQGIDAALIDAPLAVDAETPLSELLSHVGQAPCAVPVVGEEQQYVGIISKRMLLQALDREGANNG